MEPWRCHQAVTKSLLFMFLTLSIATMPALPQTPLPKSPPSVAPPRPGPPDSVEVVAQLSPEEAEDGKLNAIYESVAQVLRKGPCTPEIIKRYESEVIP